MIFVASSPLDSHLIPANRANGAGGSGLEGTGRYKLVAPSWPHGRSSRARRRLTRQRASRRRYGQARTLRRRVAPASRSCEPAGDLWCAVGPMAPGGVSDLALGIQPSASHAASTASLAFRPRCRRGCEEAGAAADGLAASQLLRASREIRGERPMWPATTSSPTRTARRIVFTSTRV